MEEKEKIKVPNLFFELSMEKEPILIRLCKCDQLPAKISYKLSIVLRDISSLSKIYSEERQKLIEKWCDKNEDGSNKIQAGFASLSENKVKFNEEFCELLNVENELTINRIEIKLDELPTGIINSYDYSELSNFIDFKE